MILRCVRCRYEIRDSVPEPGDMTQVDLPRNQRSGLQMATRILRNIEGIAHIELDEEDVVRHRLVKAIIKAYNKEHEKEEEEYANRQTPAILKKDKPAT